MRRALIAVLLLATGGAASAQTEVVSTQADSVSVTIYRDLFALVTETRTVDLPAEPVTLAFDGVVETLIPASAVVSDLGRTLEERNYDFDRLAPASLLRKSIGKTVVMTRTYPGSGKVTQTRAIVAAADEDGVTLRSEDGLEALNCSGVPEGLTFEAIPDGLHPNPRLSIRLAAGAPGKRTIKLSYIAQGFAWNSDYVAHLSQDGHSFDLTGWVTLRNLTHASLKQAEVQFVAGRLNLLYQDDGGSSSIGATEDFESETDLQEARRARLDELQTEEQLTTDLAFLHGCYPFGVPRPQELNQERMFRRYGGIAAQAAGSEMLEEIVVTGAFRQVAAPEALADYHLYRVPWPTDLNARQIKQAVFLQKPRVKAGYFYSYRLTEDEMDNLEDSHDPLHPHVMLSFENKRSSGLGDPLPGGMFRTFVADGSNEVFLGEAVLGDKPVGLPVELTLGGAVDVGMDVSFVESDVEEDSEYLDVMFRISNAKPWPVSVEIRQALDEDTELKVEKANRRTERKFGDYAWHFNVKANGDDTLTYRLVERDPAKGDSTQ